uniref:Peptidase A2 domain-containing protein n=1 Tax=Globodera rostochiensis TaxID=31243 RepID=A0A914HFQ9_GLORO
MAKERSDRRPGHFEYNCFQKQRNFVQNHRPPVNNIQPIPQYLQGANAPPAQPSSSVIVDANELLRAFSAMKLPGPGNEPAPMNSISPVGKKESDGEAKEEETRVQHVQEVQQVTEQPRQGYAASTAGLSNKARNRVERAAEGLVSSSQLASELSYLSWNVSETLSFSFNHAMQSVCEYMEQTRRWALSASSSDPTAFARIAFDNPNLHAKKERYAFVDPSTMIVSSSARKAQCTSQMTFQISKEDTIMKIAPAEEWKQTGKDIREWFIGSWEDLWWQIVSILVIISSADLLFRLYFLIKGKINSVPVRCLLDTGASVTVAQRSLINQINCSVIPTMEEAISASGHLIRFREKAEVWLDIAGSRALIMVYFTEDPKSGVRRDYQVLLGCDSLEKMPLVTFDIQNRRLAIINPTNEPVVFFKGMHLAYVNEVEEEDGILFEQSDGHAYNASLVGLGGVLMQKNEDSGTFSAVSYCSRTLSGSERRWPPVQVELCAIIYALRKQNTLADALSRAAEDVPVQEVQHLPEMEDIVEFPVCLALTLDSRIVLDPFVGTVTMRHADGNSYSVDMAQEQRDDPETDAYMKFLETVTSLRRAWKYASEANEEAQLRMKLSYDRLIRKPTIEIGDRVLLRNYAGKIGTSKKFHFPWRGIFRVIELDGVHATISSCLSPQSNPRPACTVPQIPADEQQVLEQSNAEEVVNMPGYSHRQSQNDKERQQIQNNSQNPVAISEEKSQKVGGSGNTEQSDRKWNLRDRNKISRPKRFETE